MQSENENAVNNVVADFPKNAKKVVDSAGNYIGCVSPRKLYDSEGAEIASFSCCEKVSEDGKQKKQRIYLSSAGSRYCLSENIFRLDGAYYGSVTKNKDKRIYVALLSIFIFILVTVLVLLIVIVSPSSGPQRYLPSDTTVDWDSAPIVRVRDSNGKWEEQDVVAVFPDTVQPGNDGKYGFIIENTNDHNVRYSFYLQPNILIEGNDYFPLEFMLKMNNQHIGDRADWLKVDELWFYGIDLLANSAHTFTLEWRWPFEGENDKYDTIIGKNGSEISMSLVLLAEYV